MVGASNHENTVVVLESVNLIEEVAPYVVGHDGIEILEHKIAWRKLPRLVEDLLDGIFGTTPLFAKCQKDI